LQSLIAHNKLRTCSANNLKCNERN